MATTTNYGWTTPDDTALVKDGAAAIRTLGSSVDTTTKNLNPSTTLGDIEYRSSSANINTRLGIGSSGQILTVAAGVPSWAAPAASATNKNYIINGAFAVAQRGTSFTAGDNNDDAYTLDRWYILSDTNDVIDVTQETTVIPTGGQYAIALDVETVNKKFGIATIIENKDVIGLIGKDVTFSFKAKVSSTGKLDNVKAAIVSWSGTADTVTSDIISAWGAEGTNPTLIANATYENTPANLSLTTGYQTISITANIDTAGTNNLILFVWSDVTDTTLGDFLYIAETKLELGTQATGFIYAGGNFQGELAACQRFYYRFTTTAAYPNNVVHASGMQTNTTSGTYILYHPVTMRAFPTSIEYSTLSVSDFQSATSAVSSLTMVRTNGKSTQVDANFTTMGAQYRPSFLLNDGSSGHLGVNAEL
jgi:hypothetical protein